jgi:chorismate mutase
VTVDTTIETTLATGREPHVVRVAALRLGDGPVPVLGGLVGEARPDARWIALPARPGAAAAELERLRRAWDGPLLAAPAGHAALAEAARLADGLVLGAGDACPDCGEPLPPAAARLGLPVVLRRDGTDLARWLAAAAACRTEGDGRVVLCEGADRPAPGGDGTDGLEGPPAPPLDLGLLQAARERSGLPVLAYLGHDAALAPAAVAAGADGLLLAPHAAPEAVAAAREAATVVAALVRRERPATIPDARAAIDRVDAALAVLLERRAALAGIIQRLKPVGGFAGRDPERERRLVAAMARRAPRLGEAHLAPIMNAVIEAGLRLAEEERRERTAPAGADPA